MYLLIDDVRTFKCDIIARTPEVARKVLSALHDRITCVGFDHDLGVEETGLDILRWALENDFLPDHVQLVSANPVGRQNMRRCLEDHNYQTVNGTDFYLVLEYWQH